MIQEQEYMSRSFDEYAHPSRETGIRFPVLAGIQTQ
jgi:hypothetical protein